MADRRRGGPRWLKIDPRPSSDGCQPLGSGEGCDGEGLISVASQRTTNVVEAAEALKNSGHLLLAVAELELGPVARDLGHLGADCVALRVGTENACRPARRE